MKFTKQTVYIYLSALLPFIIVEIIRHLEVAKQLNDSLLASILYGCLVFTIATILMMIEGGLEK